MIRTLFTILILSTFTIAQATYSGTRSSGGVIYSTTGATSGGGGIVTSENLYCPPKASGELTEGTPTWGVSDGIAFLPTRCMNTALTSTPSLGTTITVANGDSAGFATALNNVVCGQTIILTAGSTPFTGPFSPQNKSCNGSAWITIRSSGVTDPLFPAEGVRATPCISGITNDAVNGYNVSGYPSYACAKVGGIVPILSATILASGPALTALTGATHYRFIGIDFTKIPGTQMGQIIQLMPDNLTQGSDHIIFDRCLIHGEPWLPSSDTGSETQAGIKANNSQWIALINSWNYDTYCNSSCSDSQAYSAGTGAIQDGPHKLYNDLLTSSGESYIIGGGGVGPTLTTPNSLDIEGRSLHSFKPLTWMIPIEQAALYPNAPIVKNLGEYKNGIGSIFEGNVFENNWAGQSDQDGTGLAYGAKNQNSNDNVPLVADGTVVVPVGTCPIPAGACTGNFSPDMTNASTAPTNCAPGGCVLEVNNLTYRFCNGSNGCNQSGTSMATGTPCDLGTDLPLHSTCLDARIYIDPANPTAALPNGTITSPNVFACHPGKCASCKIQDTTIRYSKIYNVSSGLQVGTGVSSHCKDESLGNSRLSLHDLQMDGLDINATNGSDPLASVNGFTISNGQTQGVISNVDIIHNTVAIQTGNPNSGVNGFGLQIDHTDIEYLSGLNIHDNVSPAPWTITHTNGAAVTGGLATAFQTNACQSYSPSAPGAINSIVQADNTQNFTFTAIPGGLNYIVTLNGLARALTSPTTTSFTLGVATHAGDAITVRDTTQCNWTFRSNLLGLGTNMPGAGKDQSPYPDGTLTPTANNTISCGAGQLLTCLLNEGNVPPATGAFTSNFGSWTGRNGNYGLLSTSLYYQTASDAGSRAATGKSPGADLTTIGTLTTGVAASTFFPFLTITSGTLSSRTHNVPFTDQLQSSVGASQTWAGYKSWFLVTDPALCQPGGNCGNLPANSGIVIGRSGVVNGNFNVLTVSRTANQCGGQQLGGCSTITLKQSIVAGGIQNGQTVLLSNFEDGTGSAAHDSTFNGTCIIISLISTVKFTCNQPGTGFDTIASHSPNSLWQGTWKTGTTYAINEQVWLAGNVYASLHNSNQGHNPQLGFPDWNLIVDSNFVTGARAAFAPITVGTYQWWMGVRDGAFQLAYKPITLVVN